MNESRPNYYLLLNLCATEVTFIHDTLSRQNHVSNLSEPRYNSEIKKTGLGLQGGRKRGERRPQLPD